MTSNFVQSCCFHTRNEQAEEALISHSLKKPLAEVNSQRKLFQLRELISHFGNVLEKLGPKFDENYPHDKLN